MGAIPHTGGDPNDRPADEATHHTGQCSLHSRHHDHHVGGLNLGKPAQQAVQPRHADVVNPLDSVAHKVSRHRGLFGDRKIGSARSHDSNDSGPLGQRRYFKG